MGLHQFKKLLYIKGNNYQNQETAYKMGENLCLLFTRQGINIWNVQKAKKQIIKEQIFKLLNGQMK
jgi:hypothetical protein